MHIILHIFRASSAVAIQPFINIRVITMALLRESHRMTGKDFERGAVTNMTHVKGNQFEREWHQPFDIVYSTPPYVQVVPISVRSWDYHQTDLQVTNTGCVFKYASWEHKWPLLGFEVTVYSSDYLECILSKQAQENRELWATIEEMQEVCKKMQKRLDAYEKCS